MSIDVQSVSPPNHVWDVPALVPDAPRPAVAIGLAPDTAPAGPSSRVGASVSTSTTANLQRGLDALSDPMALLMGLAARMRMEGERSQIRDVTDASATARHAADQRLVFSQKAEKAARKSKKLMGRMPHWVKKMIGGIVAAVGVVGAAFTGGASLALAIVAVVLLAAGDIVEAATRRGWIDPKAGQWASLGLQLTGSALMLASGVGAAGAANTAQTVKEVATTTEKVVHMAKSVAQLASAAQGLVQAGLQAGATGLDLRAANARGAAEKQGLIVDSSADAMDAGVEQLQGTFARYGRVASRLRVAMSARDLAHGAAARQMA